MSEKFAIVVTAGVLALALGCSRQSSGPVSPSASKGAGGDAAADGSTLKVSAPTLVSPVNGAQSLDSPTLTLGAVTGKFSTAPSGLTYRFQVLGPAGETVADAGGVSGVTYKVAATLAFKTRYTWRARAEAGDAVGPWSVTGSFVSPDGGYIRGNEVFDPLFNGASVGEAIGPVTFTSEGARLEGVRSYIRYLIPVTVTTGEFAVEIKGLRANAPGDKSKVFGMMSGNPDSNEYIDNPYRVDVQYRGTSGFPPNSITYRVLYGSASKLSTRYEPTTEQRNASVYNLDPNTWYYWRYTWGKTVRVTVSEGGPSGRVIYDLQRNSENGTYDPQLHYAFIGTPIGRSGSESASIPGTIYRNVWISTRPKP